MKKDKIILYGSTGKQFAFNLAKIFPGIPRSRVDIERFSDGEIKPVVPLEMLKEKTIFYIQSTFPPAENLLEFLFTLNALENALEKPLKPNRIIAIVPYFGYGRQDKVDVPGASFSLQMIAQAISPIIKLVFIDFHNPKVFDIFQQKPENILPITLFSDYLRNNHSSFLEKARVVAPDKGAKERCESLASALSLPLSILDKKRDPRTGEVTFTGKIEGGLEEGENVISWDDILASGWTCLRGIKILKEKGAGKIILLITHSISFLIKEDKLPEILKEVEIFITTDSIPYRKIPKKIQVLSLLPVIADIIRNYQQP